MTQQPTMTLHDGHTMPQLGLGVWRARDHEARVAVREALAAGYRSIDTAAIYRNEAAVGQGLRDAGLPRQEVFITTKIWNDDQGRKEAHAALQASLERLGTDYVDLLLIHWPAPAQDRYVDTWQALIELQQQGLVRSIGVSNFHEQHLKRIIDTSGVVPVLNQIELHPFLQQPRMQACHQRFGLHTEAWSPLAQARALDEPVLVELGREYGKSAAQVMIRWHLQAGRIVIPKSVTPERIRSNFDVFDFQLDDAAMQRISTLDRGERIGPDPDEFG